MSYKVVIVDDEPLARRGIRVRLRSYPDLVVVDECQDGVEAVSSIKRHGPDLVFLDVEMPGMDGFGLLKRLPRSRRPFVIFLTAHAEYALRAFEVDAVDYLLKPLDAERFRKAVDRARRHIKLQTADSIEARLRDLLVEKTTGSRPVSYIERFRVRNGGRITFLQADDIDWIEAVGDYVGLHIGPKRPLLRATLNDLEHRLDPNQFVRIHRSSIVRASRIKELQTLPNRELRVRLLDGTDLKVSRTYRGRLDQWLSRK